MLKKIWSIRKNDSERKILDTLFISADAYHVTRNSNHFVMSIFIYTMFLEISQNEFFWSVIQICQES